MDKLKKDVQIRMLKDRIERSKEKFKNKLNNIKKLDIKIAALKQEFNAIKKKQIKYYCELLQEGSDFRQEGLIWIIKTIWYLGFDINVNKFPRFLDRKAIDFLFRLAKVSMKYNEVYKKLRITIKCSRNEKFKRVTTKQSCVWMGVAAGMLKRVIKDKIPEFNIKSIVDIPKLPKILMNSNKIERKIKDRIKESMETTQQSDETIYKLDDELIELVAQMREMKRIEAFRICKEFENGTYEKKSIIDKESVLTALIGEEALYIERYNIRQKIMAKNNTFSNGYIH